MSTILGAVSERIERDKRFTRYILQWTADGSGDVQHVFEEPLNGYLWRLDALPHTVSAAYDVFLKDAGGWDALKGAGESLPASQGDPVYLAGYTSTNLAVVENVPGMRLNGSFMFQVDAAASEIGMVTIWLQNAEAN